MEARYCCIVVVFFLWLHVKDCVTQSGKGVGCFNDRRHEWAFFWWGPGRAYVGHNATSCSRYCHDQRFLYAGLGGGQGLDCHCGNGAYDIYGGSHNCSWCNERGKSFPCGKLDGGRRLLYVYKIDPPVDVDTRHVGCWTSNSAPNVLDGHPLLILDIPKDSMTVDGCINGCRQNSSRYAGIWKGSECWCGNDLQWEGAGRSPALTGQCNLTCTGNSTEMCGGDRFISIYRTECLDGTYGLRGKACQPCNCQNDMVCNKNTGQCPGLCEAGFAPAQSGQCIQFECLDGTYGLSFKACQPCNCQNDMVCNKDTGQCPGLCKAGFAPAQSGQCIECRDNYYGLHCNSTCNCNITCDKVSGVCPGPCEEGWMRTTRDGPCSQECPESNYGPDCEFPCNCKKNCSKVTGQCFGDCIEGWAKPIEGGTCSKRIFTTDLVGKRRTSIGIGVGIGAGIAVVLAVAAIVFALHRQRKNKKNVTNGNGLKIEMAGDWNDYDTIIDAYAVGKNTSYPIGKLLPVMKARYQAEDPFSDEFVNLPSGNSKQKTPSNWKINKVIHTAMKENAWNFDSTHIKNYSGKIGYIAGYVPLDSTVDQLLLMIWNENVSKVIMLTHQDDNFEDTYIRHWSNRDGSPYRTKEIILWQTNEQLLPDYMVRTFMLRKDGEQRHLDHYTFHAWTNEKNRAHTSSLLTMLEMAKIDHGKDSEDTVIVPCTDDYYMNVDNHHHQPLRHKLRDDNNYERFKEKHVTVQGPWLVHCSDGAEKTGALIAIDYLMDQAKAEGKIDVFDCVYKLRQQKPEMVQSLDMYHFIYIALLKALVMGSMAIPCERRKLKIQFEALEILKPNPKSPDLIEALKSENRPKNRSLKVLPVERYRPPLHTTYKGSTGYINAVSIKRYHTRSSFIITQLPLESTQVDFWCLVFDYRCPVIVSLECPERDVYWPRKVNESISFGEFTVLCSSVERMREPKMSKVTLTVTHQGRNPVTTSLLYVDWPAQTAHLDSSTFFAINDLVVTEQQGRSTLPVILQCMNGDARSGLFCALLWLIDMIDIDQQADVFRCIQTIRAARPEFINSFKQYEFLNNALMDYFSSKTYLRRA